MDLFVEEIEPIPSRAHSPGKAPAERLRPDSEKLQAGCAKLIEARAPVLIVGGGAHVSRCYDQLEALQTEFGLPVATTVMGKGAVNEANPLTLGVMGNALGEGSVGRELRAFVTAADLILLIGTRTNENGTDRWRLYPSHSEFIHIDIDPEEIGRNYDSLRLCGDARAVLEELIDALRVRRYRYSGSSTVEDAVRRTKVEYRRQVTAVYDRKSAPIRPERIMADVAEVLSGDCVVVGDASYSTIWVTSYLHGSSKGLRYLTPRGIAGLGWGVPMAMGAKVGRSESTVLCFTGDGGFGHVWSELETLVRERISIVITVFNNSVLGFQKDAEDLRHGRHTDASYFAPVDHASIARAAGCAGIRICDAADYGPALEAAMAGKLPTVLDVVCDPDAYPPLTVFDRELERVRQSHMKAE